MSATAATELKPLAVRVLHVTGLIALPAAAVSFAIGGALGFDGLARSWAVIGILLAGLAAGSLLATHQSPGGMFAGLIACALLLLLLPIGTLVTILIGLMASQTWPELRSYYRLGGGTR